MGTTIRFRENGSIAAELRAFAREHGVSVSDVIRLAIRDRLRQPLSFGEAGSRAEAH